MKNTFIVLFIILTLSGMVYGIREMHLDAKQLREMNNAAIFMLDFPEQKFARSQDRYGNLYVYTYQIGPDGEYREATVRSLGADAVPNTDDDIVVSKRDYNKSKLIGEYAAQRAKELGKGIIDGLTDKSKFEK